MTKPPETRPSLLIRLRNPADQNAWFEFAEIYRPVITRLALRKGLQAAENGTYAITIKVMMICVGPVPVDTVCICGTAINYAGV